MSLADRLKAEKPVRKTTIDQYLAELSENDRKALIGAAADPSWTTAALLRVLKAEGFAGGKETFTAWRINVTRR